MGTHEELIQEVRPVGNDKWGRTACEEKVERCRLFWGELRHGSPDRSCCHSTQSTTAISSVQRVASVALTRSSSSIVSPSLPLQTPRFQSHALSTAPVSYRQVVREVWDPPASANGSNKMNSPSILTSLSAVKSSRMFSSPLRLRMKKPYLGSLDLRAHTSL